MEALPRRRRGKSHSLSLTSACVSVTEKPRVRGILAPEGPAPSAGGTAATWQVQVGPCGPAEGRKALDLPPTPQAHLSWVKGRARKRPASWAPPAPVSPAESFAAQAGWRGEPLVSTSSYVLPAECVTKVSEQGWRPCPPPHVIGGRSPSSPLLALISHQWRLLGSLVRELSQKVHRQQKRGRPWGVGTWPRPSGRTILLVLTPSLTPTSVIWLPS